MYAVLRVLKKEFIQLRRDPKIFPILFVAPIIQMIFMGYAATLDIKHIPIVIWDQDNTPASREFVRHVTSSLYFDDAGRIGGYDDAQRMMRRGKAAAALVVPAGFQRDLKGGRTATVQAVVDGADSNQALIAQNYLAVIAQTRSAALMVEGLSVNRAGLFEAGTLASIASSSSIMRGELAVSPEPRVWYNPELRSANFMIPGVVVMILMVMTMMLTSLAVVREKEVGTMEQVIVTPIRPWQFIVGKITPFVIIGFLEVSLVVLVAVVWFKIPFRGAVTSLYGYSALFLLTTLGLGLFVSTISHTQQQAMMTAFFIIFIMINLSGFIFPIENMPRPVQLLTYLIPMRYFLVIVRGVFLKGSEVNVLWDQALPLFVLGIAIIGWSVQKFGKTLD